MKREYSLEITATMIKVCEIAIGILIGFYIFIYFAACGSGSGGSSHATPATKPPLPAVKLWSPKVSPLSFYFATPVGTVSAPKTLTIENLNYGDGSKINFVIWDENAVSNIPIIVGLPSGMVTNDPQVDISIQASCINLPQSHPVWGSYIAVSYIDSVGVPLSYNYLPYSVACE